MSQIALPLGGPRTPPGTAIVVGEGNRAVADALRVAAGWPYGTMVLAGPPRSGKTTFARWFAQSGGGDAIDDADRQDEATLFHAWNRAQASGTPLLLTVADGGWTIALPDLRSRIGAALHLTIAQPGDDMAADLLQAHAATRGLVLGEGAAAYLVPRIERSHAAIERIVAEIDRLCLERRAPATMSIWRDALDAVTGPAQPRLL